MAQRVALVTGANQGIGLEIVRQLCKTFEGKVILSARNPARGREAVQLLEKEGLHPELLILDVGSEESVTAARQSLQQSHNRLDVLINNAAVLLKTKDISFPEAARETIAVNYHGLLRVTSTFMPLIQPNGRIIHLSSGVGNAKHLSQQRREAILNPDLTVESLTQIMDQFVEDAQKEDFPTKGWPSNSNGDTYYSPYKMSKIGVNRLTELQAHSLTSDPTKPGILINAVCPGWVRTQMGGSSAHRSPEQGADTVVYLALLPAATKEPNGLFLRDRQPCSWKS